ncbi:MAG: hypothetical protein KIG16_05240 [Eubacteriales bacterium]|nr:hypothetical protein [Eubacteriales bacterium]
METNESNLIKGADIRNDKELLNKLPIPLAGLCKVWVKRQELEIILQRLQLNFDEIYEELVKKGDYYCIFVGCRNCLKRRLQEHVNGPIDKSSFFRSLSGILENSLNSFIDNLYFECIDENDFDGTRKDEKNSLLSSGKFYVLNINENPHKLAKKIKPILTKYRKIAK